MKLLTRDKFRNTVFERDNHLCVVCGRPGKDAHHILERRLWSDGGYYVENGATVCERCHIQSEQTVISCNFLRAKAGIPQIVLPDHLYDDLEYDKWGNIILANGRRLKGELFFDESVQKVMKQGNVLDLFDEYVKYPRTMHLPWSNPSKDDRVISNLNSFLGEKVVVTVKMDGENFTGYHNYCHARSLEPLYGKDRGIAKSIWAQIAYDIPVGWRICAENLYAKHSIQYNNLHSYLQVFSIWNEKNFCINWDETVEWCELLNISTVPVLYYGIWDEELVKKLYLNEYKCDEMEGYVVRTVNGFTYGDFRRCVAKYVRPGHVSTTNHWRHQKINANKLSLSTQSEDNLNGFN